MSKLEELRNRLRQEEEKFKKFEKTTNTGDSYPFWNIPNDASSVLRFLPDGNPQNELFWVDKYIIKMPFNGVKGKSIKPVTVSVPCMLMYGEECQIQNEIKPLWKTDEDTARIYYKKKSFIFQGFVRKNAVEADVTPENPIRRFYVNQSIFKIINAGLMDAEMETIPTDYEHGTDFIITKGKKGEYADYSTSKWSRKSSPLTEEELVAINNFGLPDLSTFLPKKPDAETVSVMSEMFVDSMNGESYDLEKYGKYFRPFGFEDESSEGVVKGSGNIATESNSSDDNDEEAYKQPGKVAVSTPVKAAETATPSKTNVQDLLAQLKKKQASK